MFGILEQCTSDAMALMGSVAHFTAIGETIVCPHTSPWPGIGGSQCQQSGLASPVHPAVRAMARNVRTDVPDQVQWICGGDEKDVAAIRCPAQLPHCHCYPCREDTAPARPSRGHSTWGMVAGFVSWFVVLTPIHLILPRAARTSGGPPSSITRTSSGVSSTQSSRRT